MNRKINIAIDGPVGSGKSTIAKLLANKLNYIYVDTGAMYRCVALKWLKLHSNLLNFSSLKLQSKIENEKDIIFNLTQNAKIVLTQNGKVFLDDKDVTSEIRTPLITKISSPISALEKVREELVNQQKKFALKKGVIMEGRDIQTIVIPDAELKIFLIASLEERTKRRYKEYQQKGININKLNLIQEIKERDQRDSTREIAPLKKAKDAITIDTTNLTIEQVVDKIYNLAKKTIE